MAYSLILLVAVYVALAMVVLTRRPQGISGVVLAAYLFCTAAVTAGYVVLGTTADRTSAEIAAVGIVLLSSWVYMAFLPLALLSMIFEAWVRQYARWLLAISVGLMVLVDAVLIGLIATSAETLVQPLQTGYQLHWILSRTAFSMWLSTGLILISQVPLAIVLGAALHYRRLPLWRGVLPFVIASLLSLLIGLLSPLAGATWGLTVAALGHALPVLLITGVLLRAMRTIPFETLVQSILREHSGGAMVLDTEYRVVWNSALILRWLGLQPFSAITLPHVSELLRHTPCKAVITDLLHAGTGTSECTVLIDGQEHMLHITLQPLDDVREMPGAYLLTFDDITVSHIRRDLEVRSRELMALGTISADIVSSLEMDQVIVRALRRVMDITQADEAVVYLTDASAPDSLVLAGTQRSERRILSASPPTMPLHDSTVGDVVRTCETIITPDGTRDPVHGPRMAACDLLAAVTLPVMIHDDVLGVLQMGWQVPHDFDQVEITLLESVTRQLAAALDNARLHSTERRQREIAEVLREVASILNTKHFDEALQAMLGQLERVLTFDAATVLLLDTPGQLAIRAHRGLRDNPTDDKLRDVRIPIAGYPYLAELFATRQAQLVTDTTRDTNWVPGRAASYGTWMGVPLVIHDQVLGCLSIKHNQRGHFSRADLQLATTFADQAAIAVKNAQLFESEQRRRVQAETLQQASYDLVTSPDLDHALLAALTHLSSLVAFNRAQIALVDIDSNRWAVRAAYPDVAHSGRVAPLDRYPVARQHVIDARRALRIDDTHQQPNWRSNYFQGQELRSWIGMPLLARDQVTGVLSLAGIQPGTFSDEDVQLASMFANQIAAAVEIFRLLETASQHNQALRTLNTVLATGNEALTHNNLLAVTLERMLDALELPCGAIHRLDGTGTELRLHAAAGLPANDRAQLARVAAGTSLPALARASGECRTFFSVPLVAHGNTLGLLSVADESLSGEVKNLLPNVGQQLGVLAENARLFEETRQREALSTDLGRLGMALSARLNRDVVLDMICRETLDVFQVQGAYLWLQQDGELVGTAAHGPGAEAFPGHVCPHDDPGLLPTRVLHDWRPRYVNHIQETAALPDNFAAFAQAQAALAVPLLRGDVALGLLLLVSTANSEAFADWQVDQIGILGVQAALAIQNATLFDEIRRRLDQLRLVNEVGRYATAILSEQNLIHGVARKLYEVLGYDIIGLLHVTDEEPQVRSMFVRDQLISAADYDQFCAADPELIEQAISQAEPTIINHRCHMDRPIHDLPLIFDCCTLAVPLVVADEVIGVLVVARQGERSITYEDLDVLEPLATQLAISVQNAHLFDAVRQQTIRLEARVAERTAEIRQQHERTEAILRSVADAVIVSDLSGQVVMTNPVARALFEQYDLEMNLGQRIGDLVQDALTDNANHDATEVIEVGPVALQAKASPVVQDGQVSGTVVVLRDISRLQELDRMKDNFVSNVSHELRTPLANLKLYLSLLRSGRAERQENYQSVMEREIDRLERLIIDLLDLSRLQSQQRANQPQVREPVDLTALIESVINGNTAWAESKALTLRSEHRAGTLPPVLGDQDQLVRALTNLVANAISYTPEGGTITIRSDLHCPPSDDKRVCVEIIDTGIGIPDADLERIFERFQRGTNIDTSSPGTGLGLAIIKEITELHDGTIEVESSEGAGSTFRLLFPVLNSGQ